MPMMTMSDGCAIHYRFDGGNGAPVLMFSNSLGTTVDMWEPQVEALAGQFRILRYDNRGHGASDVPVGPYTVERIARDAKELVEGLGLGPVVFCGLSLGGMVGIWLGANASSARFTRGARQHLLLYRPAGGLGAADRAHQE